jgi:ketosteroid isomerase-like protein
MYEKEDVEALERQFNAAMEEADTGSALDAVRRIYNEFDRGSEDTLAALLHPQFEVHMETIFLDGKVYKGVKGFGKWRGEMEELFEEDRFQPEGIRFATGDRWLVLGRFHIKTEDGVELDVPLAHVFEQRDRKVARFTAYSDISEALASVGLSA